MYTYLIIISIICYVIMSDKSTEPSFCYKQFCKCYKLDKQAALCSGRALTYIPRLPKQVTDVTMENTNLSNIGENGFFNLTFNTVKALTLTGNFLSYLDRKSFSNLTYLAVLTLTHETSLHVDQIKDAIGGIQSTILKKIILSNNDLKSLPVDMFEYVGQTRLQLIKLEGNNLQFIDFTTFEHLKDLKGLYLSENSISQIKPNRLPQLLHLNLNRNILSRVPFFCDSSGKSYVPRLQILNLSNNGIGLNIDSFVCLPSVHTLFLEGLNLYILPDNVFASLPSLNHLELNRIGNPLKVIKDFAFNSSTLHKLVFTSSKFHFQDDGYNPDTIFAYCPNLEHLDLRNNIFFVPRMSDKVKRMFSTLTKLRSLTLSSTQLSELPKHAFTMFNFLETINLDTNHITTWNNSVDIFGNMTSLRHLNMLGNSITVINESSFPASLLKSLHSLNLERNPYSCTCNQMWFVNWLRSTNKSRGGYPTFYTCSHPSNMKGIQLMKYHPTEKICNPWNPVMVIIVSSASILAFVIALTGIICLCHSNIKNYIYLIRVQQKRRKGYLHIDTDADFEYHAFVIYCDADRSWVHTELLDKIEGNECMRLCIHHRGFSVGETITENVDNCLRKSWKVVVIISNNFCKSEWCQWEVDVVQERRRKHGRYSVIPVIIETIDTKHMTGKVRTLLDATSHITYTRRVGEDLFWRSLIESLRKPLGHPPISLI